MDQLMRAPIFIIILLIGTFQNNYASHYALSGSSKKTIAAVAAMSACICGGLGYIVHDLCQEDEQPSQETTSLWEKLQAFPWASVLIPAVLGATVAGCITYYHTPEKMLEWVEHELEKLKNNDELKSALGNETVHDLRKKYVREQFPMVSLFDRFSTLYTKISVIKIHAQGVINAGIDGLKEHAIACIKSLENCEKKIYSWLITIKDDQRYWQEVTMKSEMHARETIAAAAASRAEAEWAKAMRVDRARIIRVKDRYH